MITVVNEQEHEGTITLLLQFGVIPRLLNGINKINLLHIASQLHMMDIMCVC